MSSLWTPGGEHRVRRGPPEPGSPPPEPAASEPAASEGGPAAAGGAAGTTEAGRLEDAEAAEHLEQLRRQLLATPAEVVVANHAYGLFELAALHLSQRPAGLEQARLAIDALGALVERLAGRLGEAERSLADALGQIRLAYVRIQGAEQGGAEQAG